jgi:hypothetical protein
MMQDYKKLVEALREAEKHLWTQPQIELYPMMEAAADAIEALQADMKTYGKTAFDEGYAMGFAAGEDRAEKQMPKQGEWLKTDAFPHRVYCSCCYKTYVPNANWQIWQDDADNFGLPRNYCPNCGAKMEVQDDRK